MRAAELGSFAAAARQLELSPAAVGQAVARLETSFEAKLFQRTTRRMSLTAEGRELFERSSRLVAELEALPRVFDEVRGVVRGPLRVSAPLRMAREHVLPLVARFMTRHPDIEVTLDASDVVRDFVADRIDVAFRIGRPLGGSYVARRLLRLAAVTAASPGYLRRHGTPRHPRELEAHTTVGYRHADSGLLEPLRFRVGGKDVRMLPRQSLTANDVETAVRGATLDLGIVQPPAYYARAELEAGTLVRVLSRHTPAPWTLYLCYGSSRHLAPRIRAFVDFVVSEVGEAGFA